ncbi:MAG TPA: hypothetical protein VGR37_04600 [Longimicrobiaceae bacterium]|nr:hypothetical protein [Longimicrobiaceae bacterium]
MKGSRLWTLALAPLVLAACGANDTEGEEDDPLDREAEVAATDPAVVAVPVDTMAAAGAGAMHDQVTLNPVGGSGVSGTATLAEQGAQTQVAVQLTGLQPNSAHAGHIHHGTCESPGNAVAPLQDITADAGGAGTMTATVAMPTSTVMNGQHIVAYHESAGPNHGPTIVCGAIQGHAM